MKVTVGVSRILTRTAGAGAAVATAMAAGLLVAAPASAAPASAGALVRPAAPARTHVYRTLVTGLAVRASATTTSLKRAVLGAAGTKVRVRCFVVGQPVGGDNIWYMIAGPHAGLVLGFYLNTGSDPAMGIPSCVRPVKHVYQTLVTGLSVRTAPSSTATKRGALGPAGTNVTVRCYAVGESVSGDDIWYRIAAPRIGMVSGFYLDTGRDPATRIRRC